MGSVVALYEALASAQDDRARARVIAEAFEGLEERYPHLSDLVTQHHLRESELRLQKEIEQVRTDLTLEIAQVRAELRETELRLLKEIAQVRTDLTLQIEQLRGEVKTQIEQLRGEVKTEIERSRNSLLLWLIPLMFAQVGAITALVKLL
jgi:hypothetical protein